MLTIYNKMLIPLYKQSSEFELSFLLEHIENIYKHFIKVSENDKINLDWLNDSDTQLINENNDLLFESAKQPGIKNLISKIQNANFNDKISFDEVTFYISIENFLNFISNTTKKSINILDIVDYNGIKINQEKLRTNYHYNVKDLLEKIK